MKSQTQKRTRVKNVVNDVVTDLIKETQKADVHEGEAHKYSFELQSSVCKKARTNEADKETYEARAIKKAKTNDADKETPSAQLVGKADSKDDAVDGVRGEKEKIKETIKIEPITVTTTGGIKEEMKLVKDLGTIALPKLTEKDLTEEQVLAWFRDDAVRFAGLRSWYKHLASGKGEPFQIFFDRHPNWHSADQTGTIPEGGLHIRFRKPTKVNKEALGKFTPPIVYLNNQFFAQADSYQTLQKYIAKEPTSFAEAVPQIEEIIRMAMAYFRELVQSHQLQTFLELQGVDIDK